MQVKIKSMSREPWPRVPRRCYRWQAIREDGFDGEIALIHFLEIRAPLDKQMLGRTVRILDRDYRWLQIAPRNERWWLTVMFDPREEIVQLYFDVTGGNRLTGDGQSTFADHFLDVVAMPDGQTLLLDEDELEQARTEDLLTREEYDQARRTASALLARIPGEIDQILAQARRYEALLR